VVFVVPCVGWCGLTSRPYAFDHLRGHETLLRMQMVASYVSTPTWGRSRRKQQANFSPAACMHRVPCVGCFDFQQSIQNTSYPPHWKLEINACSSKRDVYCRTLLPHTYSCGADPPPAATASCTRRPRIPSSKSAAQHLRSFTNQLGFKEELFTARKHTTYTVWKQWKTLI